MDGLIGLVHDLLVESGLPDAAIFRKSRVELPGFQAFAASLTARAIAHARTRNR